MKKTKKRVRKANPPTPAIEGGWRPSRPTHQDVERAATRNPVEQAANNVAQLARNVSSLRSDIDRHEGYIRDFKVQLAAAMLEYQAQTTALRDLTAIPQPVA